MASVKIKIIDGILSIFKVIVMKLLHIRAQADLNLRAEKGKGFDMRNIPKQFKKLLIQDQAVVDERWSECEKCEFLTSNEKLGKTYHNCKKCGCFMKIGDSFIKTKLSVAKCPIGKWGRYVHPV